MDSRAIDINCNYLGIPTEKLMETTGKKIADELKKYKSICFFCGTGNNGGDGFVAARYLNKSGKNVLVFALKGSRSPDSQKNFEKLKRNDISIKLIGSVPDEKIISKNIKDYDVIIDSLIGVGISGKLREPVSTLVKLINKSGKKIVAVDVPSGNRVKADVVLSLHNAKVTKAKVLDIGIPPEAEKFCGPGDVWQAIPKRTGNEHKGKFGHVLVVGGSKNYPGTPSLVGMSALRSGCDLLTICTPMFVAKKMRLNPNLMVTPLEREFHLSPDDVPKIMGKKFDVMVIGNGLGREEETKEAVKLLLKKIKLPIVVDADALSLIDEKDVKKNMILTPHVREFERVFGEYDKKNRERLVEKYARKSGAVIVQKGEEDIISNGKSTRLNKSGNAYMTVGGTGDVLAGVIGGMIAQNDDLFQSACAGTFLTGIAGELASKSKGPGMVATDVIQKIPSAIKFCEKYW